MMLPSSVSLQLYSLRKLGTPARIIAAAARAGYRSVELLTPDLLTTRRTKELLSSHNLLAPSAHVGLWTIRRRLDHLLDSCAELGVTDLIISSVPRWRRRAGAEYWHRTGSMLGELAARIATSTDIRLGYHNHAWELKAFASGSTPLQVLLQSDERKMLRWQVDLSWMFLAGQDVGPWLDFGQGRIDSVHIGEPDPGFPLVWQKCVRAGATRLIVELDNLADPEGACRKCLQNLQTLSL